MQEKVFSIMLEPEKWQSLVPRIYHCNLESLDKGVTPFLRGKGPQTKSGVLCSLYVIVILFQKAFFNLLAQGRKRDETVGGKEDN